MAGEGRCSEGASAGRPCAATKNIEAGGTPPAPIKIVAGFELPVGDHPRPGVYMLNAGAHWELGVVIVVGPQTASAPPESGHSTAVPKRPLSRPSPFGSGGTEGHLKRPLWRAPFSGLFSRLSAAVNQAGR